MRKSPKDVVKIHRLPKVGDKRLVEVTITRVAEDEGWNGRVTYTLPGSAQKVTVSAEHVPPADND